MQPGSPGPLVNTVPITHNVKYANYENFVVSVEWNTKNNLCIEYYVN